MPNVILGSTGVEHGIEVSWDPNEGFQSTRRFSGTQAYIAGKEQELILLGYKTIIKEGAVWGLEGRIGLDARNGGGGGGGGDEAVDSWELIPTELEKDILASDLQVVRDLAKVDKHFLRDCLDGVISASTYDYSTAEKTPEFANGDTYETHQLFQAICAGARAHLEFGQTLRHTKTVSSSYQIAPSLAHVGQIYKTSRLVTDEAVPAIIAGAMPVGGEVVSNGGDDLIKYAGWLKHKPTITVAARQKAQIVQEWTWGVWALILYPPPVLQ